MSGWEDGFDIVRDIRFAHEKILKMSTTKRPKRIECTEEMYNHIRSLILLRLNSYNDLFFPYGNSFDILFIQTDFSEWSSDDLKKGYKVIY